MIDPDVPALNLTAKNMLKRLLDQAEARNFDPPADTEMIADLEWMISETGGN